MKKYLIFTPLLFVGLNLIGQVTDIAPGDYKSIDIGIQSADYTKSVILLHEIYNGTLLTKNYASGTIIATRGSAGSNDRTNICMVNTSSAYSQVYGSIIGINGDGIWELKTLTYGGKKYLAVEVPFRNDGLTNSIRFVGWTSSTAENMKIIDYETSGTFISGCGISNMQNYTPNMAEYHDVSRFVVNGNVGIGTNSPSSKLELFDGNFIIKGAANDAGDLIFQKNDGSQLGRIWTRSDGYSGLALSSGDNNADITIYANGNVGIGCKIPGEKLVVDGTIKAKEIKVETAPCSDYVFNTDYKLLSLKDLEQFVKTNKHLPEVPSAKEFKKNGYSVGEMDDILLRKVEELTLYVIEQNKAIDSLKEQNSKLQNEISNLKSN